MKGLFPIKISLVSLFLLLWVILLSSSCVFLGFF
jgi:hypothetical protein